MYTKKQDAAVGPFVLDFSVSACVVSSPLEPKSQSHSASLLLDKLQPF